jgi:outer membrane biosynthesis protein TonB
MYIPNYPEDSVLRRHYEAAAALRRQARLSAPPTDSVLLRHYQQREQLQKTVPTPVVARRPEPAPVTHRPPASETIPAKTNTPSEPAPVTHRPPASAPKAEPVTAQQPTARPAQGGGLLNWLKRFFSS